MCQDKMIQNDEENIKHELSGLRRLENVAEQERANIKQRQAEGIAVAQAQGKHLGRPKAEYPEGFEKVYSSWKAEDITAKKAMQELNLKTTTFYKLANQYESGEN